MDINISEHQTVIRKLKNETIKIKDKFQIQMILKDFQNQVNAHIKERFLRRTLLFATLFFVLLIFGMYLRWKWTKYTLKKGLIEIGVV